MGTEMDHVGGRGAADRGSLERYEPGSPWDWSMVWEPFRRFWERGPLTAWTASFPAVDLYETDREVVVEADLPGVDPNDIEVEVADQRLRIRGTIRRAEEREERGVYRRERHFGSFVRTVALPEDVDVEQARASMREGVLKLRLPKKEGPRRRIPIDRDN